MEARFLLWVLNYRYLQGRDWHCHTVCDGRAPPSAVQIHYAPGHYQLLRHARVILALLHHVSACTDPAHIVLPSPPPARTRASGAAASHDYLRALPLE